MKARHILTLQFRIERTLRFALNVSWLIWIKLSIALSLTGRSVSMCIHHPLRSIKLCNLFGGILCKPLGQSHLLSDTEMFITLSWFQTTLSICSLFNALCVFHQETNVMKKIHSFSVFLILCYFDHSFICKLGYILRACIVRFGGRNANLFAKISFFLLVTRRVVTLMV